MEEKEFLFFRNATLAIIVILILLLIVVSSIMIFSTPVKSYSAPQPSTAYTTSSYQPSLQQQYSPQYQQPSDQETDTMLYPTENQNVPPCVEPCKVRVEYANKYFLPYPKYYYGGGSYYHPYPRYSYRYYHPYPLSGQRFFYHRVIQRDFTY